MNLKRIGRIAAARRTRISAETDISISWSAIGGADEAKGRLREIIEFIRDPASASRFGAQLPKAVLLVGVPGTGKTLLARATAGEARLPLLSISGAELVARFTETGPPFLHNLFAQARRRAPAILFIDDLEAIGNSIDTKPASGRGRLSGHLVIELDQLNRAACVVVLAATNRLEALDPALLRAGRFEPVPVPPPDQAGREQILHLHTRMIRLSEQVDLASVAIATAGLTGADLATLANTAALLATRRGAEAVTASDFSRALNRLLAGATAKPLLNTHEKDVLAHHLVGHALLALSLPGSHPVYWLSMETGCYSIHRAAEDRFLWAQQELENEMTVLLAGRAAEHLVFGELSTLGAIDLQKASAIARDIAIDHGMTTELGQVNYANLAELSEETRRDVDNAIRSLLHRIFSRAVEILRAQRGILEEGAQMLFEHGTLDRADLAALRQRHWSQIKGDDGGE
jgi:cell division protease FtsH